jgi:hypothetical protein
MAKETQMGIRIHNDLLEEFKTYASDNGTTMSRLVLDYVASLVKG